MFYLLTTSTGTNNKNKSPTLVLKKERKKVNFILFPLFYNRTQFIHV